MQHFNPTLLTNRAIIQASGADASKLLQSLLSCCVESLDAPGAACYGFLLTPQGRFLNELFVIKTDDGFLLDVQADGLETFLKRLKIYTLKSDAKFAPVDDWTVAATNDSAQPEDCVTIQDPRLPELGNRAYAATSALADISDDMANYNAHRITLGVPAAEDFITEKTLLLDYGADHLNGVDFEKGCYVGQEVTARMHYRAVDKKGIYIVDAEHFLPAHGTAIYAGDKEAGKLLSVAENKGIAILRHEYSGGTLIAENCPINAVQPAWLPAPVNRQASTTS